MARYSTFPTQHAIWTPFESPGNSHEAGRMQNINDTGRYRKEPIQNQLPFQLIVCQSHWSAVCRAPTPQRE